MFVEVVIMARKKIQSFVSVFSSVAVCKGKQKGWDWVRTFYLDNLQVATLAL